MKSQLVNVLLIENDTVDRMDVKRAFQRSKTINPLFFAQDVDSALVILKGKDPEQHMPEWRRLILLDVHLPSKGAWEFLNLVSQDSELKKIPIVLLIADREDQMQLASHGFNISGYIHKPMKFDELIDMFDVINRYWSICVLP